MTSSSERTDKSLDPEPWRGLPARVADLIEAEIPATTAEILESIGREVPEYARPLEGNFGRGVQTGVAEALAQFVAVIRDPDAGRGPGREVYLELGRGELRQGRTLDSLQSAYRIGARVAWRRFAEAGRRARLPAESLSLLAESIFAYIDELSADSVDGFAEAQAELEDQGRRRRRELTRLLVAAEPPAAAELAAVARAARWTLPPRLAAIACAEGDLDAVARSLPPESLAAVVDGAGCLLLADPEGPGRLEPLRRAGRRRAVVALGPPTAPTAAGQSWSLARALLDAVAAGRIEGRGMVVADDHLAELLLLAGSPLTTRIAERRLAAFAGLTERSRERMRETALAHVRHGGNAVAMAEELHVHPQTARYRIARLRELLGDQLDDPDARFELELALRAGV
ncbi:MAG: helix-turn-helix domain-containing protein [Actinobacteria bacterium]|nr:helix-turn-helix domain-containing protein [Actinomycetota bacterium]